MSAVQIVRVHSARDRRRFALFPWQIYSDDPLWVPPLIPQRLKTIDPLHGSFFQRGEADFFMAYRGDDLVGTICAAEDALTNASRGTRECLIGFLEYIDDPEVFDTLIATASAWARRRDLSYLFGPFNLDYEDSYGVLIEGWDRPPAILCGHSPPYYQDHMVRAGFEPARGDNLAFFIDPSATGLERIARVARKIRSRGRFAIRSVDFADWEAELDRVHGLLNAGLAHLPDHIGWEREALASLLAPFRQIADPELILIAEEGDDVIGWLAGIPNLNEAFIQVDGLRRPWEYLKLWFFMRRQPECLALKSVIVLPPYWNRGVGILLFNEMARRAISKGYRWADLSLTSADNPHTPMLAEHIGASIYKRYRVYRRVV